VRKGEIDGRIDPFYYIPSIVEIERKVSVVSTQNLGNFINYIASGATPKKELGELYYSDKKDGMAFLRVQNILPEGLSLEDVLFINQTTHNKMLNRSKVFPNDLLVTITGRIASSCVVPEDFEGNINQHSVVIKTDNREVSECLATYLNSTVGQTLAIRRTTGGTRPALDYVALKSIPIVFNPKIVELMKAAYNAKRAKEAEAKELLAGIDAYLLDKLGIATPTKTATKKTFYTTASKVTGGRFDPFYHHEDYALIERALHKSNYSIVHLSSICNKITDGTHYTPTYQETGVTFLSVKNVRCERFETDDVKYISQKEHEALTKRCKPELNDILLTKIGTVGLAAVVDDSLPEFSIFVSLALLKPKQDMVNPYYLSAYMNSSLAKFQSQRAVKGVGVPDWHLENIRRTEIALPPLEIQNEIAAHIQSVREKAKRLETQAKAEIEQAKTEVERMILGE
jgi:restriction endonuclease S subunit